MQFSFGCIAQLVEQLTLNQWVQGSSPCASTKKFPRILRGIFFDGCMDRRESIMGSAATGFGDDSW